MKKYILALILGFGIVLQGQLVYAQQYIEGNTYYDNKGKAYFYDENGKAFYYPEPVAIENISDNTQSGENNSAEDNKSDNVSENLSASQTVDKNILADEELMKTITPEQLEEYIAKGADVNIKFIRKTKDEQDENKIIETKDVTPLMMAARCNKKTEVIELLLKHGANIEARNEKGGTALMFAAHNNENHKAIETLLKNGADVGAKNNDGVTALMDAAADNKNPEVIELLLKNGANIEAKNNNGWTALMYAARYNENTEVIETLLKHGANIEAKKNDGWTALFLAKYNKNPKIMKLLQKNIVEIVKMYDCPKETWHKVCGIVENKTSSEQSPTVYVYYYDEDNVKIGEEHGYIKIDPQGKTKFETSSFYDQFDHYRVELKL